MPKKYREAILFIVFSAVVVILDGRTNGRYPIEFELVSVVA